MCVCVCVLIFLCAPVTKVTGITATMIRNEKPLSEVLPLFLDWMQSTTEYVSDNTDTVHYPGMQLSIIQLCNNDFLNLHFM